ncbi:MAG: hypothetical protein JXR10_09015 [Cyclobacteriaceae bacterium]
MKIETKKDYDAVRFMREQRDTLSTKLEGMSNEEILRYFEKKRKENGVKPSA